MNRKIILCKKVGDKDSSYVSLVLMFILLALGPVVTKNILSLDIGQLSFELP